jgi:MFS family permease
LPEPSLFFRNSPTNVTLTGAKVVTETKPRSPTDVGAMSRNVILYPWHHFFQNLLFWQATWFLYFQQGLSASEAILLYIVYDISVTVLEVPSGYMSDRVGRRFTLIAAALAFLAGLVLLTVADTLAVFAVGQALLGAGMAFNSGTDTALLYQSLSAAGRAEEMEAQSVRAWRFSFSALALSAPLGGAMALWSYRLPFAASALAMIVVLGLAMRFTEPPAKQSSAVPGTSRELARMRELLGSFRNPVLLWLFLLGVLMYGYSHVPFVFGQPFIAHVLEAIDLAPEAPLVSGAVTSAMMVVSVLVSLVATWLRARLGLAALLLFAFSIQIGLVAALALSGSVLAIAWLLLRMVPDSLSTPFILARVQPLLGDDSRATFLSLRSFCGRLLFALSLWLAAVSTTEVGTMPREDIQMILGAYAVAGLVLLTGLGLAALRLGIDHPAPRNQS